jgi:hypothetical protein
VPKKSVVDSVLARFPCHDLMKAYQLAHNYMVRAKFWCVAIKKTKMGQDGDIGSVIELSAVYSGSDENKKFFKWTPSAKIELGTVNEEAAKAFEIGKEYYVDFTPAPVS